MYDDTLRGLEGPATTAELPRNCPTCDSEIDAIETRAPSDHRLAPCGCAADFGPTPTSEPQPVADGGVSWTDLTGFQRDMLLAIYQMDQPKGLAVRDELERAYGEEVNHGRLYPNLDTLVDYRLVEKGELDRRTNYYEITAGGRALIEETAQVFASATSPVAADGGQE